MHLLDFIAVSLLFSSRPAPQQSLPGFCIFPLTSNVPDKSLMSGRPVPSQRAYTHTERQVKCIQGPAPISSNLWQNQVATPLAQVQPFSQQKPGSLPVLAYDVKRDFEPVYRQGDPRRVDTQGGLAGWYKGVVLYGGAGRMKLSSPVSC